MEIATKILQWTVTGTLLAIMAIMTIMITITWYKSNFINYRLQALWIKFRMGLSSVIFWIISQPSGRA